MNQPMSPTDPDPITGTFVRRLNRFVALVQPSGSEPVQAHLPNPGRLLELLFPGQRVLLLPSGGSKPYRIYGTFRYGDFVYLDTVAMNRVAEDLIRRELIAPLQGMTVKGREVRSQDSRFDLLLGGPQGDMLLEVKTCTLFTRDTAFFPDAPSERAARHARHLSHLTGQVRTGILFLVQSPSPTRFLPDWHTDPDFARALLDAREAGVSTMAVGIHLDHRLELLQEPRELAIPLEGVRPHLADRGAFLAMMAHGGQQGLQEGEELTVHVSPHGDLLSRRMGAFSRWAQRTSKADPAGPNLVRIFPVRSADPVTDRLAEGLAALGGREVAGGPTLGRDFKVSLGPGTPREIFELVLEVRAGIDI
jgi:sugar fermentation stimulation protein A